MYTSSRRSGVLSCLITLCAFVHGAAAADSNLVVIGVFVNERHDAKSASEVARHLRQLGEEARASKPQGPANAGDWSCATTECLSPIAKDLRATHLLQASIAEIDHDNKNFRITVRIYDRARQRVDEKLLSCDGCNADSRYEQVALAATQLLKKATEKVLASEPQKDPAPIAQARPLETIPTFEPATRFVPNSTVSPAPEVEITNTPAPVAPRPNEGWTWRSKLSLVTSGVAAASGVAALALTIAAARGQPLCPTNYSAPDPMTGLPGTVNSTTCLMVSLVPTWGVALLSTTVSVTLRALDRRR